MERVESFKFLGFHITNKLPLSKHTKTVMKRERSQETEKIWHGSPDPQKVLQLHHREHPDRLHHCLVWQLLGIRKALQRVVCMAQYITWAKLSVIKDLYTRRCQRKAQNIFNNSSHPEYHSSKSRSKRLLNSFYTQTIRLLIN